MSGRDRLRRASNAQQCGSSSFLDEINGLHTLAPQISWSGGLDPPKKECNMKGRANDSASRCCSESFISFKSLPMSSHQHNRMHGMSLPEQPLSSSKQCQAGPLSFASTSLEFDCSAHLWQRERMTASPGSWLSCPQTTAN